MAILVVAGCGKKKGGGGGGQGGSVEIINGIEVPPLPDTAPNQGTLIGVDVNGNGIRDDIDRFNATEFGTRPDMHAAATNFAKTLQSAITSPTEETIVPHISVINCETDSQKLSDLDKITTATLDTPERRGAYAAAFAGAVFSDEDCAQNQKPKSAAAGQGINVIYMNGIQNTAVDAAQTRIKIKNLLNASTNYGNAKKSFIFSNVWNPIGWYGTKDGRDLKQDKMELFLLKTAEEHFASDFTKIMVPFNTSKDIDKDAATRVSAYLEDMTPGGNSLEENNPPAITDSNMRETKITATSLVAKIKNLGRAIVVAHSQGNLLANLAYAKLSSEFGNDVSKRVRVVNVANTSEFSASSAESVGELIRK